MNFTFLKASGEVAFFRSDAEQADWTQEEMTATATFPYVAQKVIERGMVMLFQDPATNDWQAFEIRTCKTVEADHYQQVTAESIAIAELTDCHIRNDIELQNVSVQAALQKALAGTGWSVGNVGVDTVSSGDLYRGDVWRAVGVIKSNWNCYIEPRVTVGATGITGKYLDIISPDGVWRGLRMAVNKNIDDPTITYDDSELYTALYGYGASYTEGEGDDTQTKDTVFDAVVWQKTDSHPAKPKGQGYIEDPDKTALYGRNGRPRFGYYQNTDIKDANILLEKTWESLKQCSEPRINIVGTVADLYRLGYADQPLRLHDMAIVEIEPIGVQLYKQVIRLTVDLLNPSKNRPEIGDYIPNIIYINRETENIATGGSKGRGGGGGGGSKRDKTDSRFLANITNNGRNININTQYLNNHGNILRQAGMFIDPITGVLIYAEDTKLNIGSKFKVQHDMISTEITQRKAQGSELSSKITQTKNAISLEVSERKAGDATLQGKINVEKDRITAEVTRASTAEGQLAGRLTITEGDITAEVTRAKSSENSLSGRIQVNSDKVSVVVEEKDGQNVVKAASIVAGINDQEGSYVKIAADTINLSGYVTVSQLNTTDAKITNLTNGTTTAASIKTNQLSASSSFSLGGHAHNNSTITIDGVNYHIVTWT